jgi:hypothetical protein
MVLAANRKSVDKKGNDKICRYCKEFKGWAGRGHEEAECFTKKLMIDEDREIFQAMSTNDAVEWHKRYGHRPVRMFSKIKETTLEFNNKIYSMRGL